MAVVASAIAGLASVGVSIWGMGVQNDQNKKNNKLAEKQQQLEEDVMRFDYNNQINALQTDIDEQRERINSYDQWLGNYGSQYAQEVQSKQAQTDALMASGKETYDNFLSAIGYADAAAGATGRVGAGTSSAQTTGMLDRKLVDYVGEDRKLDAVGGLFGSQLTAANMEMGQLKADLELQRQEVLTKKRIANQAISGMQQGQNDLQDFINRNFSIGNEIDRIRAGFN